MAVAKNHPIENLPLDENQIISLYMQDFLEHGEEPKNVFTFCKRNGFTDTEFFMHFGSF